MKHTATNETIKHKKSEDANTIGQTKDKKPKHIATNSIITKNNKTFKNLIILLFLTSKIPHINGII